MNSEQDGSALGWRGVFLTIAICLSQVVLGHQVGDNRLIGGCPPSALWRREVL
jgi:hypothetical protein